MSATALTDAAAELAAELRNRNADATWRDAREFVDAGVIAAWIGTEMRAQLPQSLLAELVAERLTDDDAKTVLCSIAIGYDKKILELLQPALVEQVARTVAYQAQKILDEEPVEEWSRSERRSIARQASAYERLGRRRPL